MSFTNESSADSCRMMGDTARLNLAASVGCFVTAAFGCALNQFAPDAICAEGLAVIGCLYLIIGAADLSRMRWRERRSQRRDRAEGTSR
jgi:hypothetical protein